MGDNKEINVINEDNEEIVYLPGLVDCDGNTIGDYDNTNDKVMSDNEINECKKLHQYYKDIEMYIRDGIPLKVGVPTVVNIVYPFRVNDVM